MKKINDNEIEIDVTTKKILNKETILMEITQRNEEIEAMIAEVKNLKNQLKLFDKEDDK